MDSLTARRSNAPAAFLLLAAVLVIGAMAASSHLARNNQLGPDFCSPKGPSGILVIGIDATDILSEAQRLDVRNRLEAQVATVPSNWRVEVWNVAPASGLATMTGAAMCKPEREVSSFTSNPRKAKERFETFSNSVNQTLASVLAQPASSGSPILEAIQAIGLRSFGSAEIVHVSERRLILVSDLIQNTGQLSFTKSVLPYELFRVSKTFDALRAPLAGARVDIFFLSRANTISPSTLIAWWQSYFSDVGASITSVQRIVG